MRSSMESAAVSLQVFDFIIARTVRPRVTQVDKVFHAKLPLQESMDV